MKRMIPLALLLALCFTSVRADEGMWMLPLLQKMNGPAMKQLGCRLTPAQIYDINHTSLKDAIVHFGGGCTGEVVSADGLLLTNHHCGYGQIQALSTDEHNWLEEGFWAMTRKEELPAKGLTVTFLEYMLDVTDVLAKAQEAAREQYRDSTDIDRLVEKAETEARKALRDQAEKDHPHCKAALTSFYNDNVTYLIVSKTYRDVRLVGTPPASMGKFGGETDNWMWPRHTCDFSMFRIYSGPDGEPADYAPENVPLKAKRHLSISLKGVKEGDFSMIMGYPGRTQRFQTADQLRLMLDQQAISIEARTLRQDIMWKAMEANPSVRLKYASKYAGSANGWKKWQGERKAFKDLDIIGREERKEAGFSAWVMADSSRKAKYGHALSDISASVDAQREPMLELYRIFETVGRVELADFAQAYEAGLLALKKEENAADKAAEIVGRLDRAYRDYYEPLDREEAKALMKLYKKMGGRGDWAEEGDLAEMDIDAYVDKVFNESVFTSKEKLTEAVKADPKAVLKDPACAFAHAVRGRMNKVRGPLIAQMGRLRNASKAFGAGLLEWNAGKPSYPDANSTMRLTYGSVKTYSPRDGIHYSVTTTLDGVMEKEDPDNYEFRVPAKLKALWKEKDFGRYAGKDGRLVTCFLTNNDITGGNSGSPVMNAKGQLIGLAFDGNWESMSSDVMFEPDLQRCICVDIRYVLFVIEKFGGAAHLVEEMTIAK